jgi:hypothetical protein
MSARDLLAALPVELIGAAQQAIVAEGFHNALEGDAGGNEEGAEHEDDDEEEDDEEGDEDEEVTSAADACPWHTNQDACQHTESDLCQNGRIASLCFPIVHTKVLLLG